jgi:hypothetical protein
MQLVVRAFFALAMSMLMLAATPARAHDIPAEVRVHTIVKPEGDRLHVLVRIPLALLLNIDFPKSGPGYLALSDIGPGIERAIAATGSAIALFEDGTQLSLQQGKGRISLPSDRSFEDFETARALIGGPALPADTYVFWNQGYFDAHLQYAIRSPRSGFTLDFNVAPGLGDRLKVDLRYISADGVLRAYDIPTGGGSVALDPNWYQASWSFVVSGFEHILAGADHLLFLLCLILPFRAINWKLAGVITSFTVGHSFSIIAAAYQFAPTGDWFAPLVELLIAASIVYMAIENVIRPNLNRRWVAGGLFGIVHGFGFSFMLQEQMQFAGSHLLLSLLSFNIGIELGQLLVLVLAMPLLVLLYRSGLAAERMITGILGLLVGHTAWHWIVERAEALGKADWEMADAGVTEAALLVALIMLACGLAARAVRQAYRRGGMRQDLPNR